MRYQWANGPTKFRGAPNTCGYHVPIADFSNPNENSRCKVYPLVIEHGNAMAMENPPLLSFLYPFSLCECILVPLWDRVLTSIPIEQCSKSLNHSIILVGL